jgi:hypothetical protein
MDEVNDIISQVYALKKEVFIQAHQLMMDEELRSLKIFLNNYHWIKLLALL